MVTILIQTTTTGKQEMLLFSIIAWRVRTFNELKTKADQMLQYPFPSILLALSPNITLLMK